ncbi:N-6 DNA methylase [Flavobacterium psychraquaticum]|uniref:N-6 DNA methylase n=1 Tax=Flavobacterium psychraquaticum TaxID=3103958 RepID=UPI002ACDE7FA|nr:N-6 DNA methylase [Flavobacterium sp. LB-N7T]
MSLSTLIKTIQDIMRKDVGVDGDAQRISQMVWLLFLKIFDDKEKEWEITIDNYKSPLQSRFKWSNWAANDEGMTGEELIDFVNNDLFPSLKKLSTTAGVSPHGKIVGSVFEDAYNYMKSGTLLRQVINTIQDDVDFNSSSDRHVFNDIYEKILQDLQSAGNAGEYYTPRAVTQFMVDILNPQLGDRVFDPACGTGGFLVNVIEHKKKLFKTLKDIEKLQDNIHGIEKKPLPHMLAMTNMMLHGIDVPSNIRHDNTLSKPLKDYGTKDRMDIIITNPPFGGVEEDGIEKNFPKKYQTRETADLFMALIMHLLRADTGKAGVVLPDGFLFGEGVKTNLKRELLKEFNLHTIVRLPKGVFSPYTSISTNILFFDKGKPTKEVWFFEHPYPEGYKSYSRSKPLRIEEFDLEKKWWNNRKQNEYAWKVSVKEIEEKNYNLDFKNPHSIEFIHTDPEILMKEYEEISNELNSTRDKLKLELKQNHKDHTFIKYFDKIYSTKESIEKLKNVILNLGVKGEFGTQNKNDQPVSELLEQIDLERKLLIKNKKISKQKELLPLTTFDKKFELPSGWDWVRLNEFGTWKSGSTPSRTNKSFYDGEIPWVKSGEVKQGRIKFTSETITSYALEKCSLHINPIGSVLIAMYGANIGEAGVLEIEAATNQAVCACNTFEGIDNNYLYNLLLSLKNNFISQGAGAAQPNISREKIINTVVPLPPYEEQKRIVARISQLFELCDKLEKKIEQSSQKQSQILNAVLAEV